MASISNPMQCSIEDLLLITANYSPQAATSGPALSYTPVPRNTTPLQQYALQRSHNKEAPFQSQGRVFTTNDTIFDSIYLIPSSDTSFPNDGTPNEDTH